ncbi:hypothetical protein K0M31_018541 [Melipona bicolor]|uniref:Uncharacterized protein n=1 Tax=Melipona bicolor TaxID=60889 RepID=A0AA40G492_9HYME|nr:hypothetical protein K0M31_018541 [Melipona bicolor]
MGEGGFEPQTDTQASLLAGREFQRLEWLQFSEAEDVEGVILMEIWTSNATS